MSGDTVTQSHSSHSTTNRSGRHYYYCAWVTHVYADIITVMSINILFHTKKQLSILPGCMYMCINEPVSVNPQDFHVLW